MSKDIVIGTHGQVIKNGELDYEATMLRNNRPRPLFRVESEGDFKKFQESMRRVLGIEEEVK
jgi:hypothetical protein